MREFPKEERTTVIKFGKLENKTGYSYYEKSFPGGFLVWRIDNRNMYQAIAALKQNQEELELKLELAQEHFNWEEREQTVKEQKEIFEHLHIMVKNQIIALELAYKEFKHEEANSYFYFRKMLWTSVFLKRYVNLFLLYKSGNSITQEEMGLCLLEFGEKLKWFPDIRATEVCIGDGVVPPLFALSICKLWISLLEWCEYNPSSLEICMENRFTARFLIDSIVILKKEEFLDWYLHRESMELSNIIIHEKKKQKNLEIHIAYGAEEERNVSD